MHPLTSLLRGRNTRGFNGDEHDSDKHDSDKHDSDMHDGDKHGDDKQWAKPLQAGFRHAVPCSGVYHGVVKAGPLPVKRVAAPENTTDRDRSGMDKGDKEARLDGMGAAIRQH